MTATAIDLSAIKTDALSAASTFRTLIGLGTLATQSPTGTANSTTYLRGDFTWQTISAGASWGSITGTLSSQTDLQSALDAKASLSGATFTGRITTPSILLSGNYSSTAWTTSGVGLSHTARTLTDTSSTGTVATAYTNVLGGNTIAASNATTFTDYASLFLGSPTAGTNVTITNPFSLITQGAVRVGGQLSIQNGTITANTPAIDVSQTWNNNSVGFTGFKFNATDTASNSFSLIADWQIGGVQRFAVSKLGYVSTNRIGAIGSGQNITFESNNTQIGDGGTASLYVSNTFNVAQLTSTVAFGWCSGGSSATSLDLVLRRDAANTLALRNDTNKQRFNLYGTYDTNGTNYRRLYLDSTTAGAFTIGVEGAGSGASGNTLALQTGGTTRLTIDASGNTGIVGSVNITNSTTGITLVNASDGQPSFTFGQANAISGIINTASNAFFNFNSGGAQNPARTVFASGRAGVSGGTTMLVMQGTGNVGIGGNVTNYDTLAGSSFVLTSGNAGLGTTSPAAKLDISDTTGAGSGSLQASALNIAQTWSTTGTPTAFKLNVTDTASNAASLLMDLQVGGSSRLKSFKNGDLTIGTAGASTNLRTTGDYLEIFTQQFDIILSPGGSRIFDITPTVGACVSNNTGTRALGFNSGATAQISAGWYCPGSDIIEQRRTTNAQTYRLYNTYTDASNYERAKIAWSSNVLQIGTEGLGTGASNPRAMEFQTAGTTRLTIGADGKCVLNVPVTSGSENQFKIDDGSTGGYFAIFEGASGASVYLPSFVGRSAGINGAGLCLRGAIPSANDVSVAGLASVLIECAKDTSGSLSQLANSNLFCITNFGTAYLTISAGKVFTLADASNLSVGTTTGTKIGTATTQKLGFWNATPIVQPANTVAIDDVLVNTGLRASGGVNNFTNTLDLTIRTVTYGATMAIDAALGNKIAITLAGNGTISNPTNAVDGRVLVFRLRQDATGSRIPVWDTKYSFVGDLATVTLSTAANKIDRVAFEYDSTDDKWYCISFIKGS